MKKNKIVLFTTISASVVLLVGCFGKKVEPTSTPSGETTAISDSQTIDKTSKYENVYGNGSGIVNYKGDIYYVEYGNSDFDISTIGDKYALLLSSNAQRYMNKIDGRGNIQNLFKVTASTYFGIVDDRFYLRTINNQLYTVNMQGENTVDLAKGCYIAVDLPGHAVYYQNEDNPNVLYKVDTQTLSIKAFDFNNPTILNNYNILTAINGVLYYSLFDEKNNELLLVEHNILDNKTSEVAKLKLDEVKNDLSEPRAVLNTQAVGNMGVICIGTCNTGTIGGYYDVSAYTFDFENRKIEKVFDFNDNYDDGFVYEEDVYNVIQSILYKNEFKSNLPFKNDNDGYLLNDKAKIDFAKKYNIDLDATLGDEAANSTSYKEESSKYSIYVEDYAVIGNKVMYKVTASRANPQGEIGWRHSNIRIASELYVKDLENNQTQFVYSYVNDKYKEQVEELLKEATKNAEISGEELIGTVETIIEEQKQQEEALKEDEMYLTVDLSSIWKNEFDVRVEEVGGTIFGKRIEYEGHHKKEEKQIKLKVSKEVGAMLTVYVDNDLHSQFVIQKDN